MDAEHVICDAEHVICPACGQPGPRGKRFCGDCGAPLPASCPVCSKAEADLRPRLDLEVEAPCQGIEPRRPQLGMRVPIPVYDTPHSHSFGTLDREQ